MNFKVTSVKISGTPTGSVWTQVHEFVPTEAEKLTKRGQFFAVISCQGSEAVPNETVAGREVLTRLHEEYFGNLEATPLVALKNALQKVRAEFAGEKSQIEIAAVALVANVVYSAATGGSRVEIFRHGSLGRILESEAGDLITASGYPQRGDILILGTKLFFLGVAGGVLRAALAGPDLTSVAETLGPTVHNQADSAKIGVALVQFGKPVFLPKPQFNFTKAKTFTKRVVGKAFGFFGRLWPARQIRIQRPEVDQDLGRQRKTTFYVGAILLVLLLVSIGFGLVQSKAKKYRLSYAEDLTKAQTEFNQARQLFSSDLNQARLLFAGSQKRIASLIDRGITDKEVTKLAAQIKEAESQILGIYREEASLFLDLSLLTSGFKGKQLTASGGKMDVLDASNKRVVEVALDTKKTRVVAGPEQLEGISQIAAYEGTVYGLGADGVYQLGTKKEKVLEKNWEGEVKLYCYAGNLYLGDKTASLIWRYSGLNGRFGAKTNWLAPGTKIDLTGLQSGVIDGNFWLLFDPFKIMKLALGSPQRFTPTMVPDGLTSARALYSDEKQQFLYVLDPDHKRVVVLNKNGVYQAEYLADKLGEATALVVSEKEKKMIFLTGDKLYSIELK